MRYVGGKSRISSWVQGHVMRVGSRCSTYLEPFLGSAATFVKNSPHFATRMAGDTHADLMEMWRAVAAGWSPPESIDRQVYETQRSAETSAFRGLVGFGGSFGGKWFGGYADTPFDRHHGRNTKPFYEAARRSVVALKDSLAGATLKTCSFDTWAVNPNTLAYCDPPYAGTLGYNAAFDHRHFWSVMDAWVDLGATVVVSEQHAPDGWQILAERRRKSMLRVGAGSNTERLERLFWKPTRSDE